MVGLGFVLVEIADRLTVKAHRVDPDAPKTETTTLILPPSPLTCDPGSS